MKGWKTALAALLITVVGATETFFKGVEFVNEDTQGYVLMGIGVLMAGLRAVTSSAIFSDE